MIPFLISSLMTVLLSLLYRIRRNKYLLYISFLPVFLFFSLRNDYGNDFIPYKSLFNAIQSSDAVNIEERIELGWIFLNTLFSFSNFHFFIFSLTVISFLVYYKLMRLFIPHAYYWLFLFLILFDSNILLIQASAMRQNVAILCFMCANIAIYYNKKMLYLGYCVIACFFHSTAILLTPLILLQRFNLKIKSINAVLIAIIYLIGSLVIQDFKIFIRTLAEKFISPIYLYYMDLDFGTQSLSNVLFYSFLFYVLLRYYDKIPFNKRYIVLFSLFGIILIPFCYIIPMLARFTLYFSPLIIISFIFILMQIKDRVVRRILLVLFIAVTLFRCYSFFFSETYSNSYLNYHSILFTYGS